MFPNYFIFKTNFTSTTTGTQKDTYLEFDRVLRIKKASNFGIEFKTTEKDGIVFYIADERNVDFIALLIKDGKVNTVKPVYNGHPWDPKIEAVVDRWPLFRSRLYYTICNWAFKMVVFVARWPLFGGGR